VGPVYLKATNSNGGDEDPTPPPPLVNPTISFDPTTAIVTGNGFLPNTTVYIRVVIQGFPSGISDHRETQAPYPQTTSDGHGNVRKQVIPASSVPPYVDSTITLYGCFPGEYIYISANDGRKDPNDLTETLWSNTPQVPCPAATITAENGGSLSASRIQLDFPPHATASATTVTFNELSAPTQSATLGEQALRSFTLQGQTDTGQPVMQFQRPYTITVGYTPSDLAAGVSEASLKLAFWDTASNHWVSVPMSVDTVNHSVTASLDHFTEFALFGSKQLDDFNRPNGSLGSSWSGHTEGGNYQIHDQQLHVHVGDRGTLYWQSDTFGSMQEAFVTLARLDTRTKGEDARQSVLLKVQGAIPDTINGAIEVRYYAQARKVRVQSRLPGQNWQVLTEIPASFADGDQLGARALAGGHVQVFLNGMLIGEADAGAFFANIGGRIGLRCIDARDTLLDDFGGGDVSSMDRNPTPSNNGTSSVVHLPLLWR
jgi:hypothetical protein